VAVPNRRQSDEEEGIRYDFPIFLTSEDRAHLRIVVGPRNQLIDFAIVQEILLAGEWAAVLRYDCHGSFHVHRFTRRGAESKTELGDRSDLGRKFDEAAEDLRDHWQDHRWRYLNG
jgi:hypothetical protein